MDITDVRSRLEDFQIVDKRGAVVPFRLNAIQNYLADHETSHDIVLKPRQVGLSTYELGKSYGLATANCYVNVALISHEREATRRLFKVLKRFHEMLPDDDKPEVSDWNRDTISFPGLGSTIYVGTAGARKFGRGDIIHRLHATEVAFWENADENLTAVLQSVPPDGSVCIESTPNGAIGKFYEMYIEAYTGLSPYRHHFFPWWMQAEYQLPVSSSFVPTDDEKRLSDLHHLSPEQITWRRFKQAELKAMFYQEYPEDPLDCFLMTGGHVFDANVLRDMMKLCREADICEDDGGGTLRIWDKPRVTCNYVIGADAGEGHKDGDFSTATVMEYESTRHIASLNGRWPPDEFAAKLDRLGRLYNNAYVCCEANGPGLMVNRYLDDFLHYPNLHWGSDENFVNWELGWKTTFVNKPLMVLHLEETIRHRSVLTYDAELVNQFRNYRRVQMKTQNRYEAAGKGHDDLLMAYIIALEVRSSAAFGRREEPRKLA